MSRSSRYVETPTLLPPKVGEFGHQPFAWREQESLAHWLREPTWPRDTLNIYALEGYLTALLVWPVELQPGAWLPPIWNETGWKVPPPINTAPRYGKFLELVLGFLRTIDQGLLKAPPLCEPRLRRLQFGDDRLEMKERAQHWAQGFGRALRQGVQTRGAPNSDAREAVRTIAIYAGGESRFARDATHHPDIDLMQAVLALASSRMSRGPLGPLLKQTVTAARTDPPIEPEKSAAPPRDGPP